MYNFFGGVSRILVPDNLKTGVISHKKYDDPVLNKVYQEMADYYSTTIIIRRHYYRNFHTNSLLPLYYIVLLLKVL